MNLVLIGIVFAFLFYLLIPSIVAFLVSRRWHKFRRNLIASSYLPVYPAEKHGGGSYRFFGKLDAIEGKDVIWLNAGNRQLRVNLKLCPLYILPGKTVVGGKKEKLPQFTRWKNLSTLPEGMSFFVAGYLNTESQVPVFESHQDEPLLVVMHDNEPDRFLSQALKTGRQRNAYWNGVSPFSFLLGAFIELLLQILAIQSGNINQVLLLFPLALFPGIILSPPGIFFYFRYRYYWQLGYRYLAEADLLRLPLRYPENRLPDGDSYRGRRVEKIPELSLADKFQVRRAMAEVEGGPMWCYAPEKSSDPFAEHIYINGDPQVLAEKSGRRARAFQVVALLFFVMGSLANVFLIDAFLAFWLF